MVAWGWGEEAGRDTKEILKGAKETLPDEGYVHYLNYGEGLSVYICQNLPNGTL